MNFPSFWSDLLELFKDVLIWFLNFVIKAFADLINTVSDLLPTYTLPSVKINDSGFPQFLSMFNWFFPVDTALFIVSVFVFSVGLYFTLGVLTRWVKITN